MSNVSDSKENGKRKSLLREITWGQRDELATFEKVGMWILSNENQQKKTEETSFALSNFDSPVIFPEQMLGSPVLHNRQKRFKCIYKRGLNNIPKIKLGEDNGSNLSLKLDSPKTPPSTIGLKTGSSIIRRRPLSLRKRKLFEENKIKTELSSLNSDICNSTNNNKSPVMVRKSYSFRKKERSFVIREASPSQIPDTVPVKIEEVNDASLKINDYGFKLKANNFLTGSQQIEPVKSDEDDSTDKENLVVDDDSEFENKTKSEIIDDLCMQESKDMMMMKVDIASPNFTQDSDTTYCSIAENRVVTIDICQSSDNCVQSLSLEDKKDTGTSERISLVSSYSVAAKAVGEEKSENETRFNFNVTSWTKKKKKVKGSLGERLQNLVGTAASFVRLWRHQITQPQFQESSKQFVLMDIKKFYTINGCYIFECQILSDYYKLLSNFPELATAENIIVMAISEIVGPIVIFPGKNCMKLYTPWKIVEKESRLMEASYFTIHKNLKENEINKNEKLMEMIIRKFDCPCLHINRISKHCDTKFTNCKPCVIEELFKS